MNKVPEDLPTLTFISKTLREVGVILGTVGEVTSAKQCLPVFVKINECEEKLLKIKDVYPAVDEYLERIKSVQNRLRAIWDLDNE